MKITNCSYDESVDTFTVSISSPTCDHAATMTVAYSNNQCVIITTVHNEISMNESCYFNIAQLAARALDALHDAQEEQAAELPCHLTFPIELAA